MTDTMQTPAKPFTCKVKFDDAGIYGCNVSVLDPRDNRWVPLRKTICTLESYNVEPYFERVAFDDRAEATAAAKRFISKIARSMGVA